MRAFWSSAFAILALVPTITLAEPYPVPLRGDSTLVSTEANGERVPGIKSKSAALLYSLLGTAVPAAATAPFVWTPSAPDGAAIVLVGALIVGPSLGHFYSERPGAAFAGIGIRLLAGAGVAVGGLASTSEFGATNASNALAAAGAIIGGASVIWDILRAPHSAEVHNDRARPNLISIGITPPTSTAGIGLTARMTF